eukprot:TRINITY_DN17635_c0_g1_i1.p1 TRINITY_DN17635_c0_g1~~TRINITY_DN17635_c0_g1_i1.p1  ORF type:complete len:742 (-),score=116.41 TRINITY_DN17635_c0_g1_i1:129-2354(-)
MALRTVPGDRRHGKMLAFTVALLVAVVTEAGYTGDVYNIDFMQAISAAGELSTGQCFVQMDMVEENGDVLVDSDFETGTPPNFPWYLKVNSFKFPTIAAVHLNAGNFFNTVTNAAVDYALIEFYADWCPHCQHFAPEYERFAATVKKYNENPADGKTLFVGSIDCVRSPALCMRFGVQGFPTMHIGPKANWLKAYGLPKTASVQQKQKGLTEVIISPRSGDALVAYMEKFLQVTTIAPLFNETHLAPESMHGQKNKIVKKVWTKANQFDIQIAAALFLRSIFRLYRFDKTEGPQAQLMNLIDLFARRFPEKQNGQCRSSLNQLQLDLKNNWMQYVVEGKPNAAGALETEIETQMAKAKLQNPWSNVPLTVSSSATVSPQSSMQTSWSQNVTHPNAQRSAFVELSHNPSDEEEDSFYGVSSFEDVTAADDDNEDEIEEKILNELQDAEKEVDDTHEKEYPAANTDSGIVSGSSGQRVGAGHSVVQNQRVGMSQRVRGNRYASVSSMASANTSMSTNTVNIDPDTVEEKWQLCGTPWESYGSSWQMCKGTWPNTRGFTCGLWMLLHAISLATDKEDAGAKRDLNVLRDGVKHFYQCKFCLKHFLKIPLDEEDQSTRQFSGLWWWRAHNIANKRIGATEVKTHNGDPNFPKVQWPSVEMCPQCRRSATRWNLDVVYRYLRGFFVPNVPQMKPGQKTVPAGQGSLEETAGESEYDYHEQAALHQVYSQSDGYEYGMSYDLEYFGG